MENVEVGEACEDLRREKVGCGWMKRLEVVDM
jgi:hypothetical protein